MSKVLVTYFSASGITKRVAERLSSILGSDLFEIVPVYIYTKADLNWMNRNSRSSVEMADRNSRPKIKNKVDISSYEYVFVGFPIWWYREPSIIDTFIEEYDFSGKIIIPFATSGGSGLGEAPSIMRDLAKGAKVLEGKRFSSRVNDEELKNWIKGIIE